MTVITAIIGIYFWSHPKFSVGLCLSSVGSVISSPSSSSDHKHCCLLPSPFIFLIKSLHPQLLASARISTSVGRGIHLAFIISLLSHSQSSTFLPVHAEHSNFIRRWYAFQWNPILLICVLFFMAADVTDEPQTVWPSSQDKPRDKAVCGSMCLSTHPYKSHTAISVIRWDGSAFRQIASILTRSIFYALFWLDSI